MFTVSKVLICATGFLPSLVWDIYVYNDIIQNLVLMSVILVTSNRIAVMELLLTELF